MRKEKEKLYYFLIGSILLISCIPVFTMYLMEGGIIQLWIQRMEELYHQPFLLFPRIDTAINYEFLTQALHSNVPYFLPALFFRITGNLRYTWVISQIVLQLASMGGAFLLYNELFQDKTDTFWGILIYMTFPFRIYLCYGSADFSQAFVWMLIPYYVWSLLYLRKKQKPVFYLLISAILLAMIGYTNSIFFVILAGLTFGGAIFTLDLFFLLTLFVGTLLAIPGLKRMFQFLLGEQLSLLTIPLGSIMPKGYNIGSLFSAFQYYDAKPGIGLGLLFLLALFLGYWFIYDPKILSKRDRICLLMGVLFLACSTKYFPWDLLQRIRPVTLKLVALLETPTLFLPFACFALTIPAIKIMSTLTKKISRNTRAFLITVVLLLCMGTAIYQCNMYVFTRFPLPI